MYSEAGNISTTTRSTSQGPSNPIAPALSRIGCDWREKAIRRLTDLALLRMGWDGHQGLPLDRDTMEFAVTIIAGLMRPSVPIPSIVPLSYGGLQIEWHRNGWDVEIEFIAPYEVEVYEKDVRTGEDKVFPLTRDFRALDEVIEKIKKL